MVLLVLVIPSALLLAYVIGELRGPVEWLEEANRHGVAVPKWLGDVPFVGEALAEEWARNLAEPKVLGEIVQLVSGQNIASIRGGCWRSARARWGRCSMSSSSSSRCFHLQGRSRWSLSRQDRSVCCPHAGSIFPAVLATVSSTVTG